MAEPITWRNVTGPSLADASRPLFYAQNAIEGAFGRVGDAVKQYETGQKDIWKQQDTAATQDALSQIYRAKTVDEFNALRASGALDQATAANGAVIDRAAVNALADGRTSTLQQRDVQGITYKNTMDDAAQAPEVRRIQLLTLTNPDAAAAELAAKPDLRAAVQLAQGIDARKQTITDRERADTRFTWDTESQKWKAADAAQKEVLRPFEVQSAQSKLDTEAQQRAASRAQAGLATAQANALAFKAEEEAAARQAAVDRKILATALKDNQYEGGVLTPGSSEELAKLANTTKLGSGGDTKKLAKTMERLTKLANEGIELTTEGPDGKPIKTKVPVPLELAKAALLGSSDTFWSINEGYADTFENTIRERMGAVKETPQLASARRAFPSSSIPGMKNNNAPTAVNPYVRDYARYQRILDAGVSVPSDKKK